MRIYMMPLANSPAVPNGWIGLVVRMVSVTGVAEFSSSVMTSGSSFVPMPEAPVMRKPPSSSEKE